MAPPRKYKNLSKTNVSRYEILSGTLNNAINKHKQRKRTVKLKPLVTSASTAALQPSDSLEVRTEDTFDRLMSSYRNQKKNAEQLISTRSKSKLLLSSDSDDESKAKSNCERVVTRSMSKSLFSSSSDNESHLNSKTNPMKRSYKQQARTNILSKSLFSSVSENEISLKPKRDLKIETPSFLLPEYGKLFKNVLGNNLPSSTPIVLKKRIDNNISMSPIATKNYYITLRRRKVPYIHITSKDTNTFNKGNSSNTNSEKPESVINISTFDGTQNLEFLSKIIPEQSMVASNEYQSELEAEYSFRGFKISDNLEKNPQASPISTLDFDRKRKATDNLTQIDFSDIQNETKGKSDCYIIDTKLCYSLDQTNDDQNFINSGTTSACTKRKSRSSDKFTQRLNEDAVSVTQLDFDEILENGRAECRNEDKSNYLVMSNDNQISETFDSLEKTNVNDHLDIPNQNSKMSCNLQINSQRTVDFDVTSFDPEKKSADNLTQSDFSNIQSETKGKSDCYIVGIDGENSELFDNLDKTNVHQKSVINEFNSEATSFVSDTNLRNSEAISFCTNKKLCNFDKLQLTEVVVNVTQLDYDEVLLRDRRVENQNEEESDWLVTASDNQDSETLDSLEKTNINRKLSSGKLNSDTTSSFTRKDSPHSAKLFPKREIVVNVTQLDIEKVLIENQYKDESDCFMSSDNNQNSKTSDSLEKPCINQKLRKSDSNSNFDKLSLTREMLVNITRTDFDKVLAGNKRIEDRKQTESDSFISSEDNQTSTSDNFEKIDVNMKHNNRKLECASPCRRKKSANSDKPFPEREIIVNVTQLDLNKILSGNERIEDQSKSESIYLISSENDQNLATSDNFEKNGVNKCSNKKVEFDTSPCRRKKSANSHTPFPEREVVVNITQLNFDKVLIGNDTIEDQSRNGLGYLNSSDDNQNPSTSDNFKETDVNKKRSNTNMDTSTCRRKKSGNSDKLFPERELIINITQLDFDKVLRGDSFDDVGQGLETSDSPKKLHFKRKSSSDKTSLRTRKKSRDSDKAVKKYKEPVGNVVESGFDGVIRRSTRSSSLNKNESDCLVTGDDNQNFEMVGDLEKTGFKQKLCKRKLNSDSSSPCSRKKSCRSDGLIQPGVKVGHSDFDGGLIRREESGNQGGDGSDCFVMDDQNSEKRKEGNKNMGNQNDNESDSFGDVGQGLETCDSLEKLDFKKKSSSDRNSLRTSKKSRDSDKSVKKYKGTVGNVKTGFDGVIRRSTRSCNFNNNESDCVVMDLGKIAFKQEFDEGVIRGEESRTQGGDESDCFIIDDQDYQKSGIKERLQQKIKYDEPLVLKPGKDWRRSFLASRRSTININCRHLGNEKWSDSTASDGIVCACIQCKRSTIGKSILPERLSVRVVPLSPSANACSTKRLSYLENYAVSIFPSYVSNGGDETLLRGFLEHLSLGHDEDDDDDEHEEQEEDRYDDLQQRPARRDASTRNVDVQAVTARDVVLSRCNQSEPLPFEKCYPNSILQNCQKIGEGVFGEVFLFRNPNGGVTVIKVIPIEGSRTVNGERQKKFEEILSEITIQTELTSLRDDDVNCTSSFSQLQRVMCVKGRYPDRLLELWDLYEETHGTENESPETFDDGQLYVVLELANGGKDMESYAFGGAAQACSLFKQLACTLAVAEASLEFEHRDLHWGNVLVTTVHPRSVATYRLNGKTIKVATHGVQLTIIDYTLSRIKHKGICIYNDLSVDPDLFTAQGDYQFEIYRLMKEANKNNWQRYEPYTNILWLHYILDKMLTALRYKSISSRAHIANLRELKNLHEKILSYKSSEDFVTNVLMDN